MKLFIFTVMSLALSAPAMAENLLDCNPPMGSGLQEIKITQVGNKIYRSELNFFGSQSKPVQISALAWISKDLKWTSAEDGQVHLHQMKINGQITWSYEANRRGVVGNCNR